MIEIKALSLFQRNPQCSYQESDFWNSFTKQTQQIPYITWNNNTMIMISLIQMRQCKGCGIVRMILYSTHTCDLVQTLESASPASCKTPATSIDPIPPNSHPGRKKSWKKIRLQRNSIVLPWPRYTEPQG